MPRAKAKTTLLKTAARAGVVRLLVEPEDGISALIHGLDAAKRSIDILIFRFDHREVEQALLRAAGRGVRVHALIAYTNRGGEKNLRALELRLLGAGIIVARTADNLARYHGKMIIIDERKLYVLAFNFTYLDIEHSCSFGVILEDRKLVREAMKLFEADVLRQPYAPGAPALLISPLNARAQLEAFLEGAQKALLIYDPNVSDSAMLRILAEKSKAGVEIKILGRAAKFPAHRLAQIRLHARVILRDGNDIFIGSQSLRTLELDGRREVGVIFRDRRGANRLAKIFQEDWELAAEPQMSEADHDSVPSKKIAKKVAKALTKEMPPVAEVLDLVVKEVAGDSMEVPLNAEQLQDTVTDALKRAVKEAVRDAVEHKAP